MENRLHAFILTIKNGNESYRRYRYPNGHIFPESPKQIQNREHKPLSNKYQKANGNPIEHLGHTKVIIAVEKVAELLFTRTEEDMQTLLD